MELSLIKVTEGVLVPGDEQSREFVSKIKTGKTIRADFKSKRNARFHRKYLALLNYAFSRWEPLNLQDPKWKGVTPKKSFTRFRKDLAILSGFYDATYRVDGSVRVEAKSISFAKMKEEDFEQLYSNTIDVVIQKILANYTHEELDRTITEVMSFA